MARRLGHEGRVGTGRGHVEVRACDELELPQVGAQDRNCLIRRNRTGADRRYTRAELTAGGQALGHELDTIARTANEQLLTGLTDDEITQLQSVLQRLITNASDNNTLV